MEVMHMEVDQVADMMMDMKVDKVADIFSDLSSNQVWCQILEMFS